MDQRKTPYPVEPTRLSPQALGKKLSGLTWDSNSGRWNKTKMSNTSEVDSSEWGLPIDWRNAPLFEDMADQPGTFLKMMTDVLTARGYKKLLTRKNDDKYEDAIRARLKAYIKKEISWIEFENVVLDWAFFNWDQLEAIRKRPTAAPQTKKEITMGLKLEELKMSEELRSIVKRAMDHFPGSIIVRYGA